jgi:hypothetical protein
MPSFGASQSVSGRGGLNSGRFSKMCMRVDGVAESGSKGAVAKWAGPGFGRPTPRAGAGLQTGPNASGPFVNSQAQMFRQFWLLSGVTRDSTGAALGSCTVHLFLTQGDIETNETISDTSGNFSFNVGTGTGTKYYIVAYLPGAPDRAGTSLNTLAPILA